MKPCCKPMVSCAVSRFVSCLSLAFQIAFAGTTPIFSLVKSIDLCPFRRPMSSDPLADVFDAE